jgi:hypothetical protein
MKGKVVDGEKMMILTLIATYEVHNLSAIKEVYKYRTMMETSRIPSLNSYFKFLKIKIEVDGAITELNENQIAPKLIVDAEAPSIAFEKDIEIAAGESAKISVLMQQIKDPEGYDIYITTFQTVGFSFNVVALDENIIVRAAGLSSVNLEESFDHQPAIRNYHWEYKRPIFPYQGVHFTWKLKKEEEVMIQSSEKKENDTPKQESNSETEELAAKDISHNGN